MATLVKYILSRDANYAVDGVVPVPSQYVNAYVLTGGAAATTVTVPTGARIAIFTCTAVFYLNWGAAAAVPVADITNGSGPEISPVARDVSGDTSFSVIAPADCVLSIAYYK